MKRIVVALSLAAALSGCGIFKGDSKPKTPVLGERIPVLTSESGAEVDPAIADLVVALPPSQVNASWAQPGGNAEKSMGNPSLAPTLSRVWSANIAGSSTKVRLAAGPVIADGRVYVTDTGAVVHAFNAATGAQLWRTSLGDGGKGESSLFGGGVSADGGRVYATTGTGDAFALDAATGAVVWKKHPGGPLRGAPTIANGHIYVVSQDNQIFALNQENGDTVWNEAATLENAGVFGVAAPASAQGTVVAGFSSGELNAYRYENGRAVWQDALSRTSISTAVASLSDIDANPVIDRGIVYAVGQGGRMVALDLVSGQRVWELNLAGIATPWVAGEWLFVVTDDGRLLCILRASGKIRWITQLPRWKKAKSKKGAISWVGPVLAGDRLIVASSEGELINVAVADGKVGTTIEAGGPVFLQPAVAGNTLYILDNEGRLSAWR
ncbi:MAG: enzyme [Sphingomonas bacterium]|jgi:outer membrane protein assembly factor BamB|nr:enzyme [Sphingomonas bacterium]MDB5684741.1 enzyme [Sphingomonas bacterium]MDB5718595.1 enzyme [Sphingomonas bacterium]